MSRAYETFGEAISDPASNISQWVAKCDRVKRSNDEVIAAWMAKGLTLEQAWAEALKSCRPVRKA